MHAKDLAQVAGTTVRTIRYYHQLGLLSIPEPVTTWRSYGFVHLSRLMRIRWLVESGVPLSEVPHLLRAPGTADERSMAVDDLGAVVASIDTKIATLEAQRMQVATMLDRVRAHGRLSPLPASVLQLYAALLERDLPEALVDAMARERDLLEMACYRGALPSDAVIVVDAMCEGGLDELCEMWRQAHEIDVRAHATGLTEPLRAQVRQVVRQVLELAHDVAPAATTRLMARATEMNRPVVRAAIDLAYPSPTYRYFVHCVAAVATEQGAA